MVNVLAQQLCTDAQVDVAVDWESRDHQMDLRGKANTHRYGVASAWSGDWSVAPGG